MDRTPAALNNETSRPEIVFVVLLMQATFWAAAGVSGLPFVLAGEVFMIGLAIASFALAVGTIALAIGIVRRRRRARKLAMIMESVCLGAEALALLLPLGANRGPVALLVNIAVPAAVLLLLSGKAMRARFGIPVRVAR